MRSSPLLILRGALSCGSAGPSRVSLGMSENLNRGGSTKDFCRYDGFILLVLDRSHIFFRLLRTMRETFAFCFLTVIAILAFSSMPLGQAFIWCSIAMLFIVALVIPGKIQWRLIIITPVLVIALIYGKTLQYIDATENMLKIQESMTTQSLMTGDSTRSIMQSRIDFLESKVANLERDKQTFGRSC
jgi:hypothetical protein